MTIESFLRHLNQELQGFLIIADVVVVDEVEEGHHVATFRAKVSSEPRIWRMESYQLLPANVK